MSFTVSEGAIASAYKVVIYGPEGIGKTTLARSFPGAVFIDTEGSTVPYPVRRITPPDGGVKPTSWQMLLSMVEAVRDGQIRDIQTLVVDTADWAEALCLQEVCDQRKLSGIEDVPYGKGYTYAKEKFGKLLNLLSEVVSKGIHVVVTAHAALRRIEAPEETGAYDHWEMKLEKKDAALVKEWADMILFCNFKIIVIKGNSAMDKNKAAGGKRMMYTTHTPWWDAKNRYGLPEEMPMDFAGIAHLFSVAPPLFPAAPDTAPAEARAQDAPTPERADTADKDLPFFDSSRDDVPPAFMEPPKTARAPDSGIPRALADLMAADGITEEQLQSVVAKKGYYPPGTPIGNYDPQFVSGCLIACWNSVKAQIE